MLLNKTHFNNRYIKLGDGFYVSTLPVQSADPTLIIFNEGLATELDLLETDFNLGDKASLFSGNLMAAGAEPLAMAYSGHQFGYFSPQLGDGRALLLGEIETIDGRSLSVQLKGSGRTFFSRNGDGRSALGPVLREYLLSEAMAKLGVPTTRALAAVTTGEQVVRQQLLPGGVITRIATSFVRVGTFQYFASRGEGESIRQLADYVIESDYPFVREDESPYLALLNAVIERQAALIAKWMSFGFIHGVMNTDNMSIAGETIDYGPCAFMDAFSHNKVFSSIDREGRYAYYNQPAIGLWNLTRLAESLVPLLADDVEPAVDIAKQALEKYMPLYEQYWLTGMRDKLGLSIEQVGDKELVDELLDIMASNRADFTLTFYYLSQLDFDSEAQDSLIQPLFVEDEGFNQWVKKWRHRLAKENISNDLRRKNMRAVNPVYIPRNHQVEAAIRAAEDEDDFSVFHKLHQVLQNPYEFQRGQEVYMQAPEEHEIVRQTFCGT